MPRTQRAANTADWNERPVVRYLDAESESSEPRTQARPIRLSDEIPRRRRTKTTDSTQPSRTIESRSGAAAWLVQRWNADLFLPLTNEFFALPGMPHISERFYPSRVGYKMQVDLVRVN